MEIMQRKLNVLVVSGFDLDNPAGGINTMMHTLDDHLSAACRVVLLEAHWESPRPVRQVVNGVVRYRLRLQLPYSAARPVYGFVGWLVRFPWLLRALTRIMRDESIDIVHLHYGAAYQFYFRLARRLTGVPYLLTLHRGDIVTFPQQSVPEQWLMRFAVKGATSVVAVSNWLASQARDALGDLPQLIVIPNGLDFDALDALYDPAFEPPKDVPLPAEFFLMVSNVTHYKAQDLLIRAWAEVRARHPGLQLLIVGEGRELWDECLRLIDQTGCGDTVRMVGPQPRKATINLMHRARALIVPSRSEGLPYVLLEAGAIGIPVICSDIGPFVEVVEDGKSAFVTPVEDYHAIAEAVDRVVTDPDSAARIGGALKEKIRSGYSAGKMAAGYLAAYRAAVAGSRRD